MWESADGVILDETANIRDFAICSRDVGDGAAGRKMKLLAVMVECHRVGGQIHDVECLKADLTSSCFEFPFVCRWVLCPAPGAEPNML